MAPAPRSHGGVCTAYLDVPATSTLLASISASLAALPPLPPRVAAPPPEPPSPASAAADHTCHTAADVASATASAQARLDDIRARHAAACAGLQRLAGDVIAASTDPTPGPPPHVPTASSEQTFVRTRSECVASESDGSAASAWDSSPPSPIDPEGLAVPFAPPAPPTAPPTDVFAALVLAADGASLDVAVAGGTAAAVAANSAAHSDAALALAAAQRRLALSRAQHAALQDVLREAAAEAADASAAHPAATVLADAVWRAVRAPEQAQRSAMVGMVARMLHQPSPRL